MNSTPKQQEGDGSVAASGSRSPLEQTVMGMAPPPPGPAMASAATAPIEPASIIPTSSAVVASSPSASTPSAFTPPTQPPADAADAGAPPSATLVAAPTLPVSRAPAEPASNPTPGVVPTSGREMAAPSGPLLGATLRIEPSVAAAPAPPRPVESEAAARAVPSERTALTDDYLREARAAALDQAAQRPSSPEPLALAATARAPMDDVAAAAAGAWSAGDTHRSVAPALQPELPSASTASHGASAGGAAGPRGFEPVPVVRAHLAESLSSALGPLAELGGARHLLPPSARPRPAAPREREGGAGRWLLLAAVALITVGVVSVGSRLWHRYRAPGSPQRELASVEASASSPAAPSSANAPSASHALLANRPAPAPGGVERVRVVSATAAAPASAPGSSASPESQLAATAGRHVLSGNYAEALPLYRQLERSWPDNTAYAAMARLLEKKVGSHNDTRTVAPAAAP